MITKFNRDVKKARELTVAIVIPAYNEEKFLGGCLDSIAAGNLLPDELIVVNNNSTDNTKQVALDFEEAYGGKFVYLEQNESQGITPTRNMGFNAVSADIIIRIDADSIVSKHYVQAMKLAFSDERIDAVTGPTGYYDMPLKKITWTGDHLFRLFLTKAFPNYYFLFGSNMAVRRVAWEKIAPQTCADKEDLMHEDLDLSVHLDVNGFQMAYNKYITLDISARRINDSYEDFKNYLGRFDRTYKAHNIKYFPNKIAPLFLKLVWVPGHLIGKLK